MTQQFLLISLSVTITIVIKINRKRGGDLILSLNITLSSPTSSDRQTNQQTKNLNESHGDAEQTTTPHQTFCFLALPSGMPCCYSFKEGWCLVVYRLRSGIASSPLILFCWLSYQVLFNICR